MCPIHVLPVQQQKSNTSLQISCQPVLSYTAPTKPQTENERSVPDFSPLLIQASRNICKPVYFLISQ